MKPITNATPATPTTSRDMRELGPRANQPIAPTFGVADPILWMLTTDNQGRRWRGNNNGRPNLAHVYQLGDNFERTVDERTRNRYRTMVDHHGHLVDHVLSCGAAHVVEVINGRFSRDLHAQQRLDKAFALGWIDVNGGCLIRQVAQGLVRGNRLRVDLKGQKMCPVDAKSCKHVTAEREARQARNAAKMAAIELANKSEEKKNAESNAALTMQIAELVAQLAAKELKK
jgi:hypothetical protein